MCSEERKMKECENVGERERYLMFQVTFQKDIEKLPFNFNTNFNKFQ